MSERGRPLSLWGSWWNAIELLRPAFSRLSTFLWFATIVAGMTVRSDMLGVTSIVRALNLRPTLYHRLLAHFHSTGVKLDRLTALWAQVVLRLFPTALRVNGRLILIGDGIKCPKRGKKMPAVKLLHQQSDANTKPEYIMGHSLQAVSVLVRAANSFFAVPLAARIHEGLVWSNRDRRTLLDKMLALLGLVGIATPFYFVADAYYAAAKVANGLLAQGHHLVTRVKSNAVAYAPAEPPNGKRKRGRPRRYGRKIKLKSLLSDPRSMIELASPVYGERNVMLRYRVCDLIWRPAGRLVRFKQAVRLIGAFAYHFWMMDMTPLRYRNGNQHLHRQPADYRNHVRRKMHAYHVFIQAGVVAQGLLQYLAVVAPKLVWDSFGSWLRTIRPGIPPSEFVVANALRHLFPDFLLGSAKNGSLAKFIADRQDTTNMQGFRLAS
jgi:hypothetical protein